jgi:hypothetical protein
LVPRRREELLERRPEAERPVADSEIRRELQPALLKIAQQLKPALLCFDSRTPSSMARNRFCPRSFTPISTSAHNRSSSARNPD